MAESSPMKEILRGRNGDVSQAVSHVQIPSLSQEKPIATSITSIPAYDEPVPHLNMKIYLSVFAVCLIYFAQVLNVVGAGARAQDIAAVLGGSSKVVWLTSTVAIMTVVLSPPVSQASDYWGRRWFLIVLTGCGAIGSVIVARATTMDMAIAGQVVTGLSYGAQPLLHAVASEILPRRYRPFAQGLDNIAAALAGVVALLVGGAMTRNGYHEGFRNYWYFSAAVYVIATVLCAVLYNPPTRPSQLGLTNGEKFRQLDWIGYLLLTSGLVLFCVGLSWSQNPYKWNDAHTLGPFLIGIALISGLIIYETMFNRDGMFHHDLFSQGRNFPIALLCVFVEGLSFFAANNYFAFEVSVLYENDSLIVATRYSITFIVYAVFAALGGIFCSKTKMVRWPSVVAFLFMAIFFVLMATANPESSRPVWGYPVFLGIGLGIALNALLTIAQLSTPKELIATTSGLMIGMRSLGGSVGLAIYNAIFTAKLAANLGPKVAKAVLPLGLPSSSLPALIGDLATNNQTAIQLIRGITPEIVAAGIEGLYEAYSVGFRFVWVAAAAFMALAAICAVFLTDPGEEFNMLIDAPAEKQRT